jgi:hypothetical protein
MPNIGSTVTGDRSPQISLTTLSILIATIAASPTAPAQDSPFRFYGEIGFNRSLEVGDRAIDVAAGWGHSVLRLDDGRLLCFGRNDSDECRPPASVEHPATPIVEYDAGGGGIGVVSGVRFEDGSIELWGVDAFGRLDVPAGLGQDGAEVVSLSIGRYHVVAALDSGGAVAWGSDVFGMTDVPAGLGDGVNRVVEVDAGNGFTIARTFWGDLVHWGDDRFDQANIPVEVGEWPRANTTRSRWPPTAPSGRGV